MCLPIELYSCPIWFHCAFFSFVSLCYCALLWHYFLPFSHQVLLPTGLSLWVLAFAVFFLEKFCQSSACCHNCKVWSSFTRYCMCSCCIPLGTIYFFCHDYIGREVIIVKWTRFWKTIKSRKKFVAQPYWLHFLAFCFMVSYLYLTDWLDGCILYNHLYSI